MSDAQLSRRRLLQLGAVGAAAVWVPAFKVTAADARGGRCPAPPDFPADVELFRQGYENWSTAIRVDDLWTCAPRDAEEVVRVVNWARRTGYRVRPRGMMHNWSPLLVTAGTDCADNVVLLDTTAHLTGARMLSRQPESAAVEVGTGTNLLDLAGYLEGEGFGFAALPAPGAITIGGALAIGAHGASLPATGEQPLPGQTYGSLSNLIVALDAVVWSRSRDRYEVRRFERTDPEIAALMVHLGRALITSVVLRCSVNQNMRCRSRTDVTSAELFAKPSEAGPRSFAAYLDRHGRAETIEFPFVDRPWLKYWSLAPEQPPGSRMVDAPYNYPFSDSVPRELSNAIGASVLADPTSTPSFGRTQYRTVVSGLEQTDSADIWGASKNVLFYIRPTTLRLEEIGYCVLTRRRNVQRVVSEFHGRFVELRDAYAAEGRYPINGPVEIRATGLDRRRDVGIEGAQSPALSSLRRRRDRRWNVAVWFNVLTFAGTEGRFEFMRDLERFLLDNYRGHYASARPEWSKCWAFTDEAEFENRRLIRKVYPRRFSVGRPRSAGFEATRETLNQLDPHRVFSNDFLDRLLP